MTRPRPTPCCVPFCRRTSYAGHREWLCERHWRRVPLNLRRVYNRAAVRYYGDRELARWRSPPRYLLKGLWKPDIPFWALDRLWARVKRSAIERATDLGTF